MAFRSEALGIPVGPLNDRDSVNMAMSQARPAQVPFARPVGVGCRWGSEGSFLLFHLLTSAGCTSRSPSALLFRFFFGWEGSPTKIDYRKKRKKKKNRVLFLILTSLLEDLDLGGQRCQTWALELWATRGQGTC